MKKLASLFGALILIALVWAASHDIFSGEQDVWLEYIFVITSLMLAIALLWRKQGKTKPA
jgi:hypothetical protein